jgi:hypothetical protein
MFEFRLEFLVAHRFKSLLLVCIFEQEILSLQPRSS